MRVKHQNAKPEQSSAAADRAESVSSASISAKSNQTVAFSSFSLATKNPAMLKQLKEQDHGAPVQAVLQKHTTKILGKNALTLQRNANLTGAKTTPIGEPKESSNADNNQRTLHNISHTPPELKAQKGIVQRILLPLAAFKSQFKDDKETQANLGLEYHAQICDDLENYHKFEFSLEGNISEELYSGKWDARQEALLHLLASTQRFINSARKRGAEGSLGAPLLAVENLRKDAVGEFEAYYKNDEGRKALHTLLAVKAQQQRVDVQSADEFKENANLGIISSNVGDMGDIVGKLKAFQAIEEKPEDDSTRATKLATLNALIESATAAKKSIAATRNKKTYKAETLGFVQGWHESRVNALDKLMDMLRNNRGKYEDSISWKINLLDARSRNKDAAAGRGISMTDALEDPDWVEIDDGYASEKELAAETDEIVKRLSEGQNSQN